MPIRTLPVRPNLDHLKKQARELQRSMRSATPEILARIDAVLPRVAKASQENADYTFRLSDAQFVLAREYGFRSWPELKHLVEAMSNPIHAFVTAVVNRQASIIDALLASSEKEIRSSLVGAAMLGDADSVTRMIATNPSLATEALPPRSVPLLWYVCYSTFHQRGEEFADGIDAIVGFLLDHGADANAGFQKPGMDHPYTPLYGACGIANNPRVAKRLIEAGANPNDHESLYHATEHADNECLRLLIAHNANPAKTNALAHMLDREDMEGLELLLEHGADPNEPIGDGSNALHWAVKNNRSVECLQRLLDYNANPQHKNAHNETPYQLACRLGNTAATQWFEHAGLATELTPVERFLSLCMMGKRTEAEAALQKNPALLDSRSGSQRKAVADAAWQEKPTAVQTLLELGFDRNARGVHGATGLHWACWYGNPDLAAILLSHSPDLEMKCEAFGCTPFQWVIHGSDNCRHRDGRYAVVAEQLIEAGAQPQFINKFNERLIPESDAELIDYLISVGALLE